MNVESKTRPNILIIVYDDLGFSDLGCYGSTIETPTADRLAAEGLQFTNFTATPLCSPTRASLLTGCNPHRVGMGSIIQFADDQPGYTGVIPRRAPMIPRRLKAAGYGTFAAGKWHLSPPHESGPAGPFDRWPLAQGFDRFYGFLPGKTDHWRPELTIDNHIMGPPPTTDEYHLSEDLADQATRMIADHIAGRPDTPFFGYLSLGAVHSPHHAPEEYRRRYRGAFDHGWDVERERRFASQVERGIFPRTTTMAVRNPSVPAWIDLSVEEQGVAARFMEAYAGFLTHADEQIGALIDFLERTDVLDDTIVVVLSDNGATDAGGDFGVVNEERKLNRMTEGGSVRSGIAAEIGGRSTLNQYPSGWGQASNTPFRWFKHTVHNGGIRCPMIIRWGARTPALVADHVNVTDLAPTLLAAAGLTEDDLPPDIDNVIPIDGTSFLDLLLHEAEHLRPRPQYFEVKGHRALIDGRWKAVARHTPNTPYELDEWELFDVHVDPGETANLASVHPERLKDMIATWWDEAEENQVLPLNDGGIERLLDPNNLKPNNRTWVFRPEMTPVPAEAGPHLAGKSFSLDVSLEASQTDSGVIFAAGGQFSGFALYMLDGTIRFHFNAAGTRSTAEICIQRPGCIKSISAKLHLVEDGTELVLAAAGATTTVLNPGSLPVRMTVETLQCGRDLGSPVSPDYEVPFTFTGTVHEAKVTIL